MEVITKNDIRKLIATRIQVSRTKQSDLARNINATQAKLSMFINSNEERDTTLRTEELNKLFDILGINTYLYYNRSEFAKEVAKKLRGQKVKMSLLEGWSKQQLALFVDDERLNLFFDVKDEEQFEKLRESNLIDIESTFPYFKSLVQYHLLAGDEPTPSTSTQALLKIGKSIDDSGSDNSDEIVKTAFGVVGAALLPTSLFPLVMPAVAASVIYRMYKKKK